MANDDSSESAWHHRVTTLVGQRIKQLRDSGSRKTTVRELADKCEQLGHRVEPQVIHNMEAKRRSDVSVAELLVLAAALGTSLPLLLSPLGSSEHVELLPDRSADPWTAYRWLVGELPSDELGKPTRLDVTWFKSPVIAAYQRHDTALRSYLHHEGGDRALAMIAGARVEMQQKNWWRPPLPAEVADALSPVLLAFGWSEKTPGELVRTEPRIDLEDLDDPVRGAP